MFHRSERLLLRPGWMDDAAEVTARVADEAIVRNLFHAPWPYREQHAREWLTAASHPRLPLFLLTLPEAQGSPIIGACGIYAGDYGPELGYWIAREWWGRGFATEAVRATLSVARILGHSRILARHAADDAMSARVLHKSGFTPTGRVLESYSAGRKTAMVSLEYVLEFSGRAGDNDPSEMPRAA